MLQPTHATSEECRRRAEEALTLAAQTRDDWERELFQRITTNGSAWPCIRDARRRTVLPKSTVTDKRGLHAEGTRATPTRMTSQ